MPPVPNPSSNGRVPVSGVRNVDGVDPACGWGICVCGAVTLVSAERESMSKPGRGSRAKAEMWTVELWKQGMVGVRKCAWPGGVREKVT